MVIMAFFCHTLFRAGEDVMELSEEFSSVTMLFSDIVGFTSIAARLQPVQVSAG